ncbi:outer membrane beta-barrel protein [Vibrio sp. RC27]
MKPQIILLSLLAACTTVQAEDDYFSAGLSVIGVNVDKHGGDFNYGAGFTAAKIHDGNNWGVVSSFDVTSIDSAVVYDALVGPIYQFPEAPWLRLYPLIGLGYFYSNGSGSLDGDRFRAEHYDRPGFAYGGGAQFSIVENKPIYLEVNYKRLELRSELSDYNFDVMFFGFGFNF